MSPAETGLYYLQSRYYNSEWGRFVNADSQLNPQEGFTGMNLFQYCGNNPIGRIDPTGHAWWHWALGAAVVVVAAAAVVVTAGGAAPALLAVASVANGVAAATTASTVAAGAFSGSSMAFGAMALTAAAGSSSAKDFADQGNWGSVAGTTAGGGWGAASGYLASRSSRTTVYRSVSDAEAENIKTTG